MTVKFYFILPRSPFLTKSIVCVSDLGNRNLLLNYFNEMYFFAGHSYVTQTIEDCESEADFDEVCDLIEIKLNAPYLVLELSRNRHPENMNLYIYKSSCLYFVIACYH